MFRPHDYLQYANASQLDLETGQQNAFARTEGHDSDVLERWNIEIYWRWKCSGTRGWKGMWFLSRLDWLRPLVNCIVFIIAYHICFVRYCHLRLRNIFSSYYGIWIDLRNAYCSHCFSHTMALFNLIFIIKIFRFKYLSRYPVWLKFL